MPQPQQPPQLSDYTLLQILASALRLPQPHAGATAPRYFENVVEQAEVAERFPFRFSDLRIIGDRIRVLPETLCLKKNSRLLRYFDETPDDILLLSDVVLPGKHSLFFCTLTDVEKTSRWLRHMSSPACLIGTYAEQTILSAPLTAFL